MGETLKELPGELLDLVVSYLSSHRRSLCALMQTARFLRPHAENYLYHTVDLFTRKGGNSEFLHTIVAYPHLGLLVAHLDLDLSRSDVQNCDGVLFSQVKRRAGPEKDEDIDQFLSLAMALMPNLRTMALRHATAISGCLSGRHQHLQKLVIHFQRVPIWGWSESVHKAVAEIPHLAQVLINYPNLQHLALIRSADGAPSQERIEGIRTAFQGACPSLSVLEGCNSVVRLLLPGRNVRYLLWLCERTQAWPAGGHNEWSILPQATKTQMAYLNPAMREAYGRLEHLAMYMHLPIFPLIAPSLTSVKSLLLWESGVLSNGPIWRNERYLRAIEGMPSLEMLLAAMPASISGSDDGWFDTEWEDGGITISDEEDGLYGGPRRRIDPDYEVFFKVRPTLKELILIRTDPSSMRRSIPICYQRVCSQGGSIVRNCDIWRKAVDKPYFVRGWAGIINHFSSLMDYLPPKVI